ncbi:tryptophan-rich sensory protein [Candidatus Microgenomates bacterium]|nr:MAG: tryptophan-rich sensory protein [Candidatus Microgenomates bacterium]
MKSYFVYIPLVTLVTAILGSVFTSGSTNGWYKTISLPPWTPNGSFIGTVWTVIFALAAISALIVWNTTSRKKSLKKFLPAISVAFVLNAILNVLWSFIFFNQHQIGTAIIEAGILGISVAILIVLIYPISRLASYLLVPYLLWVCFATYLTYIIWILNRPA